MLKDSTSLTIASALPALFRLSTNSLLLLVPFFSRIDVQRSRLANMLAAVVMVVVVVGMAVVVWPIDWALGAHRAGDTG